MSTNSRVGRFTKPWAIGVLAVLLLAVPASAGVVVQNFLRAEISVSDACFTKTGGADSQVGGAFLTFDATARVEDPGAGVSLIQESATIRAFAGDRLLYSDAIIFGNTCGNEITLTLISGDSPGGQAAIDSVEAFTEDINVRFYLADPDGETVIGLPGTWVEAFSVIGGAATTGASVIIADGESVPMAIMVDAGGDALDGTTGILHWVAQAEHN